MDSDNVYKIRIHPPGKQISDYEAGDKLAYHCPKGFRKAQDVLLAVAKYRKKSGIFSSERSRILKMQSRCFELRDALEQDGFMMKERKEKGEAYVLIEFLSLFSDAFPNWQKEYDTLNHIIPMNFSNI